jgi:hypothetical protein
LVEPPSTAYVEFKVRTPARKFGDESEELGEDCDRMLSLDLRLRKLREISGIYMPLQEDIYLAQFHKGAWG